MMATTTTETRSPRDQAIDAAWARYEARRKALWERHRRGRGYSTESYHADVDHAYGEYLDELAGLRTK